jgi:hypothetical protein
MFATGLILNVAIAICALEALVLVLRFRLTGRGLPAREWIFNLASGVLLMLGLRWGAQEFNPVLIQAGLFVSGVFHWIDLFQRHQQYAQRLPSINSPTSSVQSGPSVYASKINPVI